VKRRILILILAAALIAVAADFVRITMDRRSYGQLVVPLMNQKDYTEAVCTIGGQKKSVATSGCGAVCIAMAASALVGSLETPETLFQWAYDTGLYFGDGLGHEAMGQLAARCGMHGEWLDNEAEPVLSALRAGRPVVAHMGPGTFTNNGHYILLYGVDGDGMIRVNDPYSVERSQETYPIDLILREVKTTRAFLALEPDFDRAIFVF
jgi:hypothetical protein